MSAPYFAAGGYAWRATPSLDFLPWGPARHVYDWLVWKAGNRRFELRYTDAQIAAGINRSRRYVQFGLAELQRRGLIVRDFVHRVNRWGNTLYHRVIKLLGRAAGGDPKSKNTTDLNSKKFDPHRANTGDSLSQPVALPSLLEELKEENNKGVVGDESDGTDSPPTPGEDPKDEAPDPAKDAEAVAEFAARFAAKAPEPPPVTSPPARPVVLSLDAALALAREKLARAERVAAQGDRAAAIEAAELAAGVAAIEGKRRELDRAPPESRAEPPPGEEGVSA